MKKFLSLVLALVMTMSLVTISAGAAEYKDDSSIKYDEAVAVISGAGIVGGYADGTFNPNGTLTRQAAAKIICNLTLGAVAAKDLGTTVAPYKDVPADNQFAGYIAYCAQMGYISGYADGTFRPNGTLTGFAFLKMLECALGYDQTIEGLVGTNWAVNVARLALEKGLTDGNDAFVGSNAITREEACQYALNALEANIVKYATKGTNITTTDGTVVNVGATPVEDVNPATTLAEKSQKKLVLNGYGVDRFDGPSRTVYFDNEKIGTFTKEADKVYTGKVEMKDIYKDFALNDDTCDHAYYAVDGEIQNNYNLTIAKGSDTKLGATGALTYVYKAYDANDKFDHLVVITHKIYGAKVIATDKNGAGDRIVKLNTGSLTFVTEDFAKDDIVFYTQDKSEANVADKVQSMVLAEKKTGTITKKNDADYTIDGTDLTVANAAVSSGTPGDEVEYYVCEAGTIAFMKVVDSAASVDTLAYVEELGTSRGNFAVLRFADGTKKTVDTDKNYKTANGALENYIVKFSVTSSGEYKLTAKSAVASATSTAYTSGKTNTDSGVPVPVDSKTVFLYKVGTNYTQYVGKENAPSFTGSSKIAFYKEAVNSAATFVYVEVVGTVTTSSSKLTVIAFKDSTEPTYEKDGVVYYEYKAIVDGEASTLKVDTAKWDDLYAYNSADNKAGFLTLTAYSTDSDGIATWTAGDKIASSLNTVKVENGVIYVAGGAYAYVDDAVVYFVKNKDHKVSVGTIDEILEDNNGTLNPYGYAAVKTDSNGKVTAVVLAVNP